jgi:methylase of polypeptide subunit release factors
VIPVDDLFPEEASLVDPARGEYAKTPAWLADAARDLCPLAVAPEAVLDLGAGLGDLGAACERRWPGIRVAAVEMEADRCDHLRSAHPRWGVIQANVEKWAVTEVLWASSQRQRHRWPLIVCNPPFTRSLQWTLLALPLLEPGGALVMIQPLEHLGGLERWQTLYRDHPPTVVGIAPRRPTGKGWEDARAIIVAMWQSGAVRASRDTSFLRAGFVRCGQTVGGLLAFQLLPESMPEAMPCAGQQSSLFPR